MTYTVPAENLEKVMKKLASFAKKADAYGKAISYTVGERSAYERSIRDEHGEQIGKEMIEVVDITVESDIIRNGDWKVIAQIEHGKEGNVVRGGYKPEYSSMKPWCCHCNANHRLRYTFIVSDGENERQVGRACLHDYTGIDPEAYMLWQRVGDLLLQEYDNVHNGAFSHVYSTVDMLSHASELIRKQGYVPSSELNSNKLALDALAQRNPDGNDGGRIASYIMSMEATDGMIANLQTLIRCGYCSPRDFGYIAYAPRMVERDIARKAKEAENAASKAKSEYVGAAGQRMDICVDSMSLVTKLEGYYGHTYVYRMIAGNNVLMWFASTPADTEKKHWKVTIK